MKEKLLFLCCLFFFCADKPDLFAQQLSPAVVWKKCLGGSGNDKANSIARTVDGGFIVAGSSTSNDGDVSGHHGSADSTDGWVAKISATGSVQWQLSLGGTGTDVFNSVIRLADGNFLFFGTTTSNDGDVTGNHGSSDWWAVKISPYGAVIWSKCYGGSMPEFAGNIKENHDGSLYLTGSTMSYDGDVTGHHTAARLYDQDIWVAKLTSNGAITWERCFGGTLDDIGYDINESDNDSFILGLTSSSTDGDFGDISGNNPRGAIIKIDSNKNPVWMIRVAASKPIELMPTGNVYDVNTDVLGCIPNLNNFAATQYEFTDVPSSSTAPSLITNSDYSYCSGGSMATFLEGYKTVGASGVARVNATDHLFAGSSDDSLTYGGFHGGVFDGFISGYKTNTGTSFRKFLGGTGDDEFTSVRTIDPNDFIIAGFTNSNDGDVSGNHGDYDVWLVKMGRVNTIKGTVYQDYNHNNVKDPDEPFVNNIIVQSQKGLSKSASSTYNGFFDNAVDTGIFSTAVLTDLPYYVASPASISSSFALYNNTDSISFALQPIPGMRDYSINIWNYTEANPGFQSQYKLVVTNKGTDSLSNKQVRLLMDNRMEYVSSAPAQTAVSGDTITWTIDNLPPRDTSSILVLLRSKAPPVLNYNDTLVLSAVIDSSGDAFPLDNIETLYQQVLGSYDPNSKEEVHAGSIALQDVTRGKDLLYTIRFQNTGNDTAYTVVIRDTLDSRINVSSLEMIAASNPYQLTIQDSNHLTWTFDHILLPDSTHNEPASHGYISYRVKPRNNLTTGEMIKNTSSAYFDFNLPVQTNTQVTVVKKDLPYLAVPQLSAFDSFYCRTSGNQRVKILNDPPASSDIAVLAVLDTVHILSVGADSSFTIDPASLNGGKHTIKVTFTNSTGQSKSTSLYFSIQQETIPKVTLSANNTVVGAGTDPVIITASGLIGSDQTPAFTFAEDNGFQNIIQPQSSDSSLSLLPSSLPPGDNWIFVKMTVTDYCRTMQSAIDSIKIIRRTSTGLIDPDFPDQLINAFPNPFDVRLMISGLSTHKQYEIMIYNNYGQKLFDKSVSNQDTYNINRPFLAKGVYVIRIYDLTRNRQIGTISMLKK